MRENKKKKTGRYVSKHAAPEKQGKKPRRTEEEYQPSMIESVELPRMRRRREQEGAERDARDAAHGADSQSGGADPDGHGEAENAAKNGFPGDWDTDDAAEETAEDTARRAAKHDRSRRVKITLSVIACILLLLGGAVTAAGYMVTNSASNLPNVYVGGVFVGGMDKDSAKSAIEASGWDEKAKTPLTVTLMGRTKIEIAQYASGAMHTVDEAADAAYAYGHTGNWYANLLDCVKSYLRPVEVNSASIVYDEEYIRTQCEEGIKSLEKELGGGGYKIDKENSLLCMVKGAGELKFDLADVTAVIVDALRDGKTEIDYDYITSAPKMPDFQKIHDELAAEPADAHFSDDGKFTVIDDVEGCDFDVAEAEDIWTAAEPAADVEIPIELTFPEVTGDYLRSLLYRDVLGTMTTYFPKSNENRISNIQLACSKIEGTILYPGDVFSYNDALGERTEAAGFKMAGAYSNGEVVEELGGGICQVSSTLYSAMLYAYRVNTVQRVPHYFPVDYLEKGYDATVSWPKPDFKFRNDTDYPIKIVTHCNAEEKSLTIEIMGTNLDGTYIQLTKDTYTYNSEKYPWIMEGYGVQVHRHVFDANGMQIDQIDEIYDVYHTHEATEQIKALDAQAAAEAAAGGGEAAPG